MASLFIKEDIELIKKLRQSKIDVKEILNKKKLSSFELDFVLNNLE